jgi:hypothetical protein
MAWPPARLAAAMSAAELFEARTLRDFTCEQRHCFIGRVPGPSAALALARVCPVPVVERQFAAVWPGGTFGTLCKSARQLLYAVPLAGILFFFPRLPGAFWALPVRPRPSPAWAMK